MSEKQQNNSQQPSATFDLQQIAKDVILTEIQAVSGILEFIDDRFEQTVKAISACNGHLIVSGIGKSAIIAQKLVATLNSTGTKATFLHAADAIHGDMGMISKEDMVLIISNSGESAEIKVLAPLVKELCQGLIALVGNAHCFLAQQSDYVLLTGPTQEACPHNLAPTSSTTAQLVLSDALAVCLMRLSDFKPSDFARLHPGGDLGKKLHLKVADLYINNANPSVHAQTELKSVIFEITKGRVGATAVLDQDNKVIGIVTDGDVRRMLERTDSLSGIQAQDISSKNPKTITPDMLAITAMEMIKKWDVGQLIVTSSDGQYLGFLHVHDLIREGIY
ncbi:arabinose-5-phosphate isomerase [Arachidicoccus rhizosphaerae]|uniref:Arabinose-5-phosphate isomerase n=1 Tax=Arachidicoccus rhizosphaerae TaxID=551991 RepID=A0A1H3WKL6_9BACT|nr:KpsF/GutQ family sugar-phosphate isomerase [Arachidicoccus rhizosphaerae]SDZ87665.1 arabinose-5-phosphate isomerase [Arachidicoccus rhizosphaerae]